MSVFCLQLRQSTIKVSAGISVAENGAFEIFSRCVLSHFYSREKVPQRRPGQKKRLDRIESVRKKIGTKIQFNRFLNFGFAWPAAIKMSPLNCQCQSGV